MNSSSKAINEFTSISSINLFFDGIIKELDDISNPNSVQYKHSLDNLLQVISNSFENEIDLTRKCREMNNEIMANIDKTQRAVKASQEDQATLKALRKEIDNAWTTVDELNERERMSQSQISKIKDEVLQLKIENESMQNCMLDKGNEVDELKEDLKGIKILHEKEKEISEALKEKIGEQKLSMDGAKSEINTLQQRISSLQLFIDKSTNEKERERRRQQNLEQELSSLQNLLLEARRERDASITNEHELQINLQKLENFVRDLSQKCEEKECSNKSLNQNVLKLKNGVNEWESKYKDQSQKLQDSKTESKLIREKNAKLESDKTQLQRKLDQAKSDINRYQKMVDELKVSFSIKQEETKGLQKEIERMKCRDRQAQYDIRALVQEKNVHHGKLHQSEQNVKKTDKEISQKEYQIKSLERQLADIQHEKSIVDAQKRQLESFHAKALSDVIGLKRKFENAVNQVKGKEMEIKEIQKCISDWQVKFSVQTNEHDIIRNDRNQVIQNLKESEANLDKNKLLNSLLRKQIKKLEDDITEKDSAYVKASYEHKNTRSRADQYQTEISRLEAELASKEDKIQQQVLEINQLTTMLTQVDDKVAKEVHQCNQILNERDVLGTQLIRSKEANALLTEKCKLQRSILRRGETQYRARLDDIRILRLKLKDINRRFHVISNGKVNIDELNQEFLQKHTELLREQAKVKILSDELENPMNVHRWRRLEGRDPSSMELIRKVSHLQKSLMAKNEKVWLSCY